MHRLTSQNPFDGTNRIRFVGYDLSPLVLGTPFEISLQR